MMWIACSNASNAESLRLVISLFIFIFLLFFFNKFNQFWFTYELIGGFALSIINISLFSESAVREKREGKRKLKQRSSPKQQASTVSENKCENSKYAKQFSPVVFYGSPHGVPPKRPARLLRLLREIRIDLAEQNKLR